MELYIDEKLRLSHFDSLQNESVTWEVIGVFQDYQRLSGQD